ncbi:hypothetical protein [Natronorubrum texcoconense]|uniref:Uncharacterized protein n=1 Tax=Natronorubrum texcoconense TaxID=1095776 RepID=A0A1G9F4A8_9EURY|nr:hypothetical protein [Natronorubrum texcoconense]SDK83244.1 hypothetical protein SAMN04515672_4085 [Natronorubrum texcoconense]
MSDLILVLLVGLFAIQIPMAVLVYIDARRLGLENPEQYDLGIILPAAGFLVFAYYLSKRGSLARRAAESDDGQRTETERA